jgi:hypothetical protein
MEMGAAVSGVVGAIWVAPNLTLTEAEEFLMATVPQRLEAIRCVPRPDELPIVELFARLPPAPGSVRVLVASGQPATASIGSLRLMHPEYQMTPSLSFYVFADRAGSFSRLASLRHELGKTPATAAGRKQLAPVAEGPHGPIKLDRLAAVGHAETAVTHIARLRHAASSAEVGPPIQGRRARSTFMAELSVTSQATGEAPAAYKLGADDVIGRIGLDQHLLLAFTYATIESSSEWRDGP